jgi:hypothetical protein
MEQTNFSPAHPASSGFNFRDFLSFKTMITLQIIQIVYVVVAILITLGALATMFGGGRGDYGAGFGGPMAMLTGGGFFGGLIILVVGNIGWRMWCELIIVFFRMNKTLNNIETGQKI